MASAPKAPFLQRVRLLDPVPEAEQLDSGDGEDASVDGWNPDDFPAWYRDKVTDGEDDDAGDSAGRERDAGDDAEPEAEPEGEYPFDLAVVQTLDRLRFGTVTVLAGDNGSGKSTLVEAIAVAAGFNPEGGSRNLVFSTYATHSSLDERLQLEWSSRPRWGWFLRAETFYGMASHIARDDDPYGGVAHIFPDLHNRSHGESFLALAGSRFTGKGLYLLDEPESALSIQGQLGLAQIIFESVAKGSQFVISTHSPLLMSLPDAVVYELSATDGIAPVGFDDLTSTSLWARFFDDPPSFWSRYLHPEP